MPPYRFTLLLVQFIYTRSPARLHILLYYLSTYVYNIRIWVTLLYYFTLKNFNCYIPRCITSLYLLNFFSNNIYLKCKSEQVPLMINHNVLIVLLVLTYQKKYCFLIKIKILRHTEKKYWLIQPKYDTCNQDFWLRS